MESNLPIDRQWRDWHSKVFDPEYPENMEELKMIISLVKLKYPETDLDLYIE